MNLFNWKMKISIHNVSILVANDKTIPIQYQEIYVLLILVLEVCFSKRETG